MPKRQAQAGEVSEGVEAIYIHGGGAAAEVAEDLLRWDPRDGGGAFAASHSVRPGVRRSRLSHHQERGHPSLRIAVLGAGREHGDTPSQGLIFTHSRFSEFRVIQPSSGGQGSGPPAHDGKNYNSPK